MNFPRPDSDSWVLITGASAGIGKAFAKRFALEKWNTVLVSRSEDELRGLARKLESSYNIKTFVVACDLSKPDSGKRVYEAVKSAGIEIEGLVNNAGCGIAGRFFDAPLERYLAMIDLMVRALVELTHFYVKEMVQKKHGFIINVSSTACFQPLPYSSVYSAAKAFVSAFTEALWMETQGTNVRVLAFCPGLTKTDFGLKAGHRDFHKSLWAEKPGAVVEAAFKALRKNSPIVISGWRNRILVFLERLIPHRLLLFLLPFVQTIRKRNENLTNIMES